MWRVRLHTPVCCVGVGECICYVCLSACLVTITNRVFIVLLCSLHVWVVFYFRSAALGGGRSSRRAEQLSTLLGRGEDPTSPLTLSTEDLSVRSASPRYHSTLLHEDK